MKLTRWRVYFPRKPQAPKWKRTLRDVVLAGVARVVFHDCSQYRVELVWPRAVTYDSAMVLVRRAKGKDASFEILGVPTGGRG